VLQKADAEEEHKAERADAAAAAAGDDAAAAERGERSPRSPGGNGNGNGDGNGDAMAEERKAQELEHDVDAIFCALDLDNSADITLPEFLWRVRLVPSVPFGSLALRDSNAKIDDMPFAFIRSRCLGRSLFVTRT